MRIVSVMPVDVLPLSSVVTESPNRCLHRRVVAQAPVLSVVPGSVFGQWDLQSNLRRSVAAQAPCGFATRQHHHHCLTF